MSNMHLVTGYAGNPHVTAEDHASMFVAAIRSGQFVMDAGNCFAVTVIDNNNIQIADGELMMQGRHVKIDPGKTVNLTVESGVLGQQRVDYIVARYTRNTDDGIEECNLVVVKGEPASSNPAAPECATGDINADKALVNDFPLYKVEISGLTLGTPTALFIPQSALAEDLYKLGSENSTAAGCFTREVDGRSEWLNPPMNVGSTYLTSERWRGKPVTVNFQEASLNEGNTYTFKYYGASEIIPVLIGYRDANGFLLDFTRDNPGVTVTYGQTTAAHTITLVSKVAVDVVVVVKYIGSDIYQPLPF